MCFNLGLNHRHVRQPLAWLACLAVCRFTAGWMDVGSVGSIVQQADICLAVFSLSLNSPLEPEKVKRGTRLGGDDSFVWS